MAAQARTLGCGCFTRIRIYDEDIGALLPSGLTGTVYMRTSVPGPAADGAAPVAWTSALW